MSRYEQSTSSSKISNLSNDELSSSDDIDLSGEIIGNNYVLIYKLGRGSYSTVWLAYHRVIKMFYAIKIQNSRDYEDGLEEVATYKILGSKKCEYINKLIESFDFKYDGNVHICMVFELMAGSIYDVIKESKFSKGLPLTTTKIIIKQLLSAINFINTEFNKIHPDIKPENILLVGSNNKYKSIMTQFEQLYKRYTYSKKNKSLQNIMYKIIDEIKYDEYDEYDEYNDTIEDDLINPEKLIIKLTDFTGCKQLDKNIYDIQLTRYYRAPEMLLYYPYNENCQIWSIGCIFYELLTGEILFNPEKDKGFSRDRYHIYEMQHRLGKIPKTLITQSKNKNYFFRNNDTLRGKFDAQYEPLYELIIKKLTNRPDINKEELLLIIDFLYKTLQYDAFKRLSAKECLNHPIFLPQNI